MPTSVQLREQLHAEITMPIEEHAAHLQSGETPGANLAGDRSTMRRKPEATRTWYR